MKPNRQMLLQCYLDQFQSKTCKFIRIKRPVVPLIASNLRYKIIIFRLCESENVLALDPWWEIRALLIRPAKS